MIVPALIIGGAIFVSIGTSIIDGDLGRLLKARPISSEKEDEE